MKEFKEQSIILEDGNASKDFVLEVADRAINLIMNDVSKIHAKQRVLILSRIISYIFQKHFMLMLTKSNETMNELEEALGE